MVKKLLLNNVVDHYSSKDLPLLIHGADGNGASLYSIGVMADLYRQGSDILFLCGYHMARDEFLTQIGDASETCIIENESNIGTALNKRVIFVARENADMFKKVIELLPPGSERLVYMKNFELFEATLFREIKNLKNLVAAGNLDTCSYAEEIANYDWATKVYFSKPNGQPDIALPKLSKYTGYLYRKGTSGYVTLAG